MKTVTLNAADSGWILVTKFWIPVCYKQEHFRWPKDTEEEVLVNCDTLVSYYLFITRSFEGDTNIENVQSYVKLYNINHFLLKVAKQVFEVSDYQKIFESLNAGKPSLSPSQALFHELYAALQNVQVQAMKEEKIIELVKFDYSNVINDKEENYEPISF